MLFVFVWADNVTDVVLSLLLIPLQSACPERRGLQNNLIPVTVHIFLVSGRLIIMPSTVRYIRRNVLLDFPRPNIGRCTGLYVDGAPLWRLFLAGCSGFPRIHCAAISIVLRLFFGSVQGMVAVLCQIAGKLRICI
ncbi:hypothetical protein D3C78_951400 [compost metagenome]